MGRFIMGSSNSFLTKNILILAMLCGIMGICIIIAALVLIPHDNSLGEAQKGKAIKIGYAVEAPFAFISEDGEVTGESPEIAKLIAKRLGIKKIIWRLTEFRQLLTELEAGQIDIIAAGMFITPERSLRANFSLPTFHVREGMLVAKGNPLNIRSYQKAVENPEIRIASLAGSVEEKILLKLGLPKKRLIIVPDAMTGRIAVESGAAEALALSLITVRWMALKNQLGTTEMAEPFEQSENKNTGYGAFVFRKSDRKLLEAWNKELSSFIGSEEHLAIISQFGLTKSELPEIKTEKSEEGK